MKAVDNQNTDGERTFPSSIGPDGSGPIQLLDHSVEDEDLSQITMSTKTMIRKNRYEMAMEKVASSMQEALELMGDDGRHNPTATKRLLQSAFSLVLEAQQQLQTRETNMTLPPPMAGNMHGSAQKGGRIVMGKKLRFHHSDTNKYGSYYGTVNVHGKPDGHGIIIYTSMNTFQGTW